MASNRQPLSEQKRLLVGEPQRESIIRMIQSLPTDLERPIEIVVRERQRARKLDQNALYHAGPLKDIATQAWINGRQFSALVLHEHFKQEFLPDDGSPEADPANGYVKDGYRKYEQKLDGGQHLVGSTTQLTVRGFSQFLEQVFAFGGNLGVQFSATPQKDERKS